MADLLAIERFFLENPWVLVLVALWVMPWKGYALWKAARHRDLRWFVALFLVQTLAILDILYIFVFSKRKNSGVSDETQD